MYMVWCTRYNIILKCVSFLGCRSMIFTGISGYINKYWCPTNSCNPNSICLFIKMILVATDISKYAGPSDQTGKNQAGPTMFSADRSESPVKICSLFRSGNNFLFCNCRSIKQCLQKSIFLAITNMFISLNKRFL